VTAFYERSELFSPALLKGRALGSHFGGAAAKRLRGHPAAGGSKIFNFLGDTK